MFLKDSSENSSCSELAVPGQSRSLSPSVPTAPWEVGCVVTFISQARKPKVKEVKKGAEVGTHALDRIPPHGSAVITLHRFPRRSVPSSHPSLLLL